MDLHDNQPGAHLRAGVPPDLAHMSTPAFGSLGTAAASRVRATASPGAPVVLMSTPAASMQHPGEGGAVGPAECARPAYPSDSCRMAVVQEVVHLVPHGPSHPPSFLGGGEPYSKRFAHAAGPGRGK